MGRWNYKPELSNDKRQKDRKTERQTNQKERKCDDGN
jgi:hypothetical protein